MGGRPTGRDLGSEYCCPAAVCCVTRVANPDGSHLFVSGQRDAALLCLESGASAWKTDKIAESLCHQLCSGAGVLPFVGCLRACVCSSVIPASGPGAADSSERLS